MKDLLHRNTIDTASHLYDLLESGQVHQLLVIIASHILVGMSASNEGKRVESLNQRGREHRHRQDCLVANIINVAPKTGIDEADSFSFVLQGNLALPSA